MKLEHEMISMYARDRVCYFVYGFLVAMAAEVFWWHREGWLFHSALLLLALIAAGVGAAWKRGKLKQVLLSLAIVVATLAAVEWGISFATTYDTEHDELYERDETLGWRFVPNQEKRIACPDYEHSVRINSRGFRDIEYATPFDRPVIAILGDSFTSNIQVPNCDDVFSRIANEAIPQYQIVNCGVNGYGQVQELLLLETVIPQFRPKIVLVLLYVRNDFDDNLGEFDWIRNYTRPRCTIGEDGELEIVWPDRTLPKSSFDDRRTITETHLFTMAKRLGLQIYGAPQFRRHRQPPELRYCRSELRERERRALSITFEVLEAIASKCASNSVKFGLVVAPSMWQVQDRDWHALLRTYGVEAADYERTQPQRLLSDWCANHGYQFCDLLPSLRARAQAGEVLHYPVDQHWNVRGNELVAELLARWLSTSGLPGKEDHSDSLGP